MPQLRPRLFIAGTRIGYAAPLQWPEPVCTSIEQAVPLEDAISDLPPLIGDWWEQWGEKGSYSGPLTVYQELMRSWLPLPVGEVPDHITRKVRGDDLETFQLMRETGLRYHQLDEDQRRYSVTRRSAPSSSDSDSKEHSFSNKYNILKPDEPCLTVTAHMSKDGYWYIHPSRTGLSPSGKPLVFSRFPTVSASTEHHRTASIKWARLWHLSSERLSEAPCSRPCSTMIRMRNGRIRTLSEASCCVGTGKRVVMNSCRGRQKEKGLIFPIHSKPGEPFSASS